MQDQELMNEAVRFAQNARHLLLLALDENGYPFCVPAEHVSATVDGQFRVTGWWYAETIEHLRARSRVGVLIWDERRDICYQVRGEVVSLEEIDVYDGYAIGEQDEPLLPQAEWAVRIGGDRVSRCVFRYAARHQGEGMSPY